MTKIPALIIQLVQHFHQSIDLYRSGALNETETRIQFINPFFEALGWDMIPNPVVKTHL
jgi:predicted type IV restriction endonuclease